MKRFSEQFKKQADAITLKASERNELKARVVSYMEYHPLPKTTAVDASSKKQRGIASEPFFTFTFNTLYIKSFSGVFALFLILSVPVAAERAIPGDVLYPVKVQFTEEIRSTLSLTPYAKVAWETQRLERRIAEARLLASEGKLTPEAQSQFADAVKTHADAAQREIAVLRESDSDGAAIAEIAFASALAVQSQVLEGHIQNDPKTNNASTDGTSILAVAEVVAQARTSADVAQNVAQPSYEKLLATVEQESTHVYELFSSVKTGASSDDITDIERRLADVKRKVELAIAVKAGNPVQNEPKVAVVALSMAKQAPSVPGVVAEPVLFTKTMLATGTADAVAVSVDAPVVLSAPEATSSTTSNVDAVELLRGALTDIQKLLNYLTNLDVRKSVSIETLVPVVRTAQERALGVQKLFDDTKALQVQIASHTLSPQLQAKVGHGQRDIDKKLGLATVAMQKGQLDTAEAVVHEANVLGQDLQKLVANEPVKSVKVEPVVQATSTTLLPAIIPE